MKVLTSLDILGEPQEMVEGRAEHGLGVQMDRFRAPSCQL